MKTSKLYEIAEKENIHIYNYKMKNHKARIISDTQGNVIFMNYKDIHSSIEEKELLAEELGHYYYDAYYSINSSKEDIERCEYKANKWMALTLCPASKLMECFESGICNLYDIAEQLELSPKIVQFAYDYYKNNNLIKCS